MGRSFAAVVVLMQLVGQTAALRCQQLSGFDRQRGRTMLHQVQQAIERQYYDSALNGIALADTAAVLEARIQQATSLADVLAAVAKLALTLNDSHTFFVPPQQTVRADYGWDMLMIGDSCYVARVKDQSDAARQGVTAGDQVLAVNGYRPTRQNIWLLRYLFRLLRPQQSLHVVLQPPNGTRRELDLGAKVTERKLVFDLVQGDDLARLIREEENEARERQWVQVEVDDAVVWKLPTFALSSSEIRDAWKRVRGHKALVLDLRGDAGGSEWALQALLGQLSSADLQIGTLHERHKQTPLIAKGSGADAFTGSLVVLVDSRSASASEVVARTVQLAHRGVVVGDRTAGAVMRGRYRPLSQGVETQIVYGVNVTEADLVMSDGGRLEGAGVVPDSLIVPTGADLAAGRDPVLARALAMVGVPMDPEAAGALERRP